MTLQDLIICQIYLAKKMKDFEMRQDTRDELRRQDEIYAKATYFIQKYSKTIENQKFYCYHFAYLHISTIPHSHITGKSIENFAL